VEPWIDPAAQLGADVRIGRFTVIHAGVRLGSGSVVGDHCVLGEPAGGAPLQIGPGALIRSFTALEEGSRIGPGFTTGHHVLVRAGCEIGRGVRIGTQTALEGDVRIGDHVRLQGYSTFADGTAIGDFAHVFPRVAVTNDPLPPSAHKLPVHIGEGASIGTGAILLPGARVGVGAFVSAGTLVRGSVPDASVLLADGRPGGPVTHLAHPPAGIAHPWMTHFAGAYPPEAQERIAALHARVLAAAREVPRAARRRDA
jgi:UDP-3-O-[3-hydroxymyristoyl] glucosamine N-acyltransferase